MALILFWWSIVDPLVDKRSLRRKKYFQIQESVALATAEQFIAFNMGAMVKCSPGVHGNHAPPLPSHKVQ